MSSFNETFHRLATTNANRTNSENLHRTVQTLTVRKRRKDCGFTRDLFLSAGKDSGRSTRAFFACLKTFRGYPIHQLHVFVMTLFCLFLQTQGEFLKDNPAMFRVTVSRASVWVWAQMSAGMNISALLKPWSCWFRHIPLVYWWQAGYEGPLGEDQLQEHSTCKLTQIKSDVLKNPFRYDIISPNPVPVHHGSERRKRR